VPRPQFRRYVEENCAYFVTTNTHERRSLFANDNAARVIVRNLGFYRDRGDFALHAWVIMPDHLHLVITPQARQLSDVMRNLKSYTARELIESLKIAPPIWQSRFHDRSARDDRQLVASIEYIHSNPVKAGLAAQAQDFAFSSARAYLGGGEVLLQIDAPDGSRLGP
jgi:REP element-mobilizing transposase RayT